MSKSALSAFSTVCIVILTRHIALYLSSCFDGLLIQDLLYLNITVDLLCGIPISSSDDIVPV